MIIAGIDFPISVLRALRNDRLVIFAGAGVSMGEPACLPDFRTLANGIASGTTYEQGTSEREDQFLGRLHANGIHVHARAGQELSRRDAEPTVLHRNLLRIFARPMSARVVTTNFDLLFEQTADELFGPQVQVFTAPALPVGNRFNGIVHVHGSLGNQAEMVLTDADFGRAYLTEGWARRFLVDLFHSYTVLFVGYSHSDTVMNYLARALPAQTERFVLTPSATDQGWNILGLTPIEYPTTDGHQALYAGVDGLANLMSRGTLDWKRQVAEMARASPPVDLELADVLRDALTDPVRTRFFTSTADHPAWIRWLETNGYLDNLFGGSFEALSERDLELAKWLSDHYVHRYPHELFHLLSRHRLAVHPQWWYALGRTIGFETTLHMEVQHLRRWVSLLLQTVPPGPFVGPIKFILPSLARKCADHNLVDELLNIFVTMTSCRLEVSSLLPFMDEPQVDAEWSLYPTLEIAYGESELREFWRSILKPRMEDVVEPILAITVDRMAHSRRVFSAWDSASGRGDYISYGRSAIESHEQNSDSDAVDVLIDITRDCLEYLALERPLVCAQWCERLLREGSLILRRLVLHALVLRVDLTADEKASWLLTNIDLTDIGCQHETFRSMRTLYPLTNPETRQLILNTVEAIASQEPGTVDEELTVAYEKLDWLHWLHGSDPSCESAKRSLESLWEQYPEFQPSEHPDFLVHTTTVQQTAPETPLNVDELLYRTPRECVDDLLSFHVVTPFGRDRRGLVLAVERAAVENFDWGLDLADILIGTGNWDADIWPPLMLAWARELDAHRRRQVLARLGIGELQQKHPRSIAELLRALVKDGGRPYGTELLLEANDLSITLWDSLDRAGSAPENDDWVSQALFHPAGILTEFWLHGLALYQAHEDHSEEVRENLYLGFVKILRDHTRAGMLARTVLSARLGFMLVTNEPWAKENLLPMYESPDERELQAVWHGLVFGSLNPEVAETLTDASLNVVLHIDDLFPTNDDVRERFVSFYADMVTYFVEKPLDSWIPRFFGVGKANDVHRFAWSLGRNVSAAEEETQREWWDRWLKRYWENRLQGVPAPLISTEVEAMLGWLPYFSALYPEAVELATRMGPASLEHSSLISSLGDGDLWSKYPQDTLKLLVYIEGCNPPEWVRHDIGDLVNKLFTLNLPPNVEEGLKGFVARLGLALPKSVESS